MHADPRFSLFRSHHLYLQCRISIASANLNTWMYDRMAEARVTKASMVFLMYICAYIYIHIYI